MMDVDEGCDLNCLHFHNPGRHPWHRMDSLSCWWMAPFVVGVDRQRDDVDVDVECISR